MDTHPTSVGPAEYASPLTRLDDRPLSLVLARAVLAAIDHVWSASTADDRRILQPIGTYLDEHRVSLDAIRALGPPGVLSLPAGLSDEYPVSATLLAYRAGPDLPGLLRVLAIAVAAALEGRTDQRVRQLCRNIRGAVSNRNSGLRALLQGTQSITALSRHVAEQLAAGGAASLHPEFAAAWRDWIGATLQRWIHADPAALRVALRPTTLAPSAEDASTTVLVPDQPDSDAPLSVALAVSEPVEPGTTTSARAAWTVSRARALARTSAGDLHLPAHQIAPDDLVATLVSATLTAAIDRVGRVTADDAESLIAILVAMATGVRESDLPLIVWGHSASGHLAAVDPVTPMMHRTVMRPPGAVVPAPELASWLVASDEETTWPLPSILHRLLLSLAGESTPQPGTPILPGIASGRVRYRLRDVTASVAPQIGMTAGQVRLALACHLASELGAEAAQIVMADTFGLSAGPAYYTAVPTDRIATTVASIQQRWFGQQPPLVLTGRTIGSRLILTDAAATEWPLALRRRITSLGHRKAPDVQWSLWAAHRDYLAASLLAATGARPGAWIGSINLDQLIPDYGLALIGDKATDQLREHRIVATGRRWLAHLRSYLDRLVEIAAGSLGPSAATLAGAILRSEQPLFAVATHAGDVRPLDAATMRALMPVELQGVANHLRHRLNQRLLALGVDHELRHAQMGWTISPAHLLADLSHWTAQAMGEQLAMALDEILVQDHWYPPTQRTSPWSWHDVPDRPLSDWHQISRDHAARHQQDMRRIREQLRAKWQDVLPGVMQRLQDAISEYAPALRLDIAKQRLLRADGIAGAEAIVLSTDHHALLCDRVRQGDQCPADATEAIVARIQLYRVVRTAIRAGIVRGPIPSRPFLSVTADPSPYLPGSGLAVRHAVAFRAALLARAKEARQRDQGPLTTWIVASSSAARRLTHAQAAVGAAARILRPNKHNGLLRLTAVVNGRTCPMAFGGLAAIALAKRAVDAPTAHPPSIEALGSWAITSLSLPFGLPENAEEAAARLEGLLHAAGWIELSGPERLSMLGDVQTAAAPVARSIARDDDWPVRTAATADESRAVADVLYEPEPDQTASDIGRPRQSSMRDYRRLTVALNPETFGAMSTRASDGHRGWRAALEKYLKKLHDEVGQHSNIGLLVGFVRHRLRYGGKTKSKLAHATLGADLTRFGADLLRVAGDEQILYWSAADYELRYLATLLDKPISARRQSYDALTNFHEYMMQQHGAPEIATQELRAIAGVRMQHVDAGVLTSREMQQVYDALCDDRDTETRLPDAAPSMVRMLQLRVVMYVVLAATGLRPSSAYGLTLGDLALIGPGNDHVRVRVTGEYGRAKSSTTLGYVPMEGALWISARESIVEWLASERAKVEGDTWWDLPLFATAPGSRRRYARDQLTRRLDQLMRWATGESAHTYWIRKERVTTRHATIVGDRIPMARDVYGVLRACGHASIVVPVTSYISDPAIICAHDIRAGLRAPRGAILAVTGEHGPPMDMAWQREGGPDSPARLRVVLDRLGLPTAESPVERITPAPPLASRRAITPRALADYARVATKAITQYDLLRRCGLTAMQANRLTAIAEQLLQRRGVTPWPVPGLRHRGAVMAVPRPLAGTDRLFALLDTEHVDPRLIHLAEQWTQQPHLDRLHPSGTILHLVTDADFRAAQWLLETTHVRLHISASHATSVLRAPTGVAASRSHAAGVQWVLALIWAHHRLIASSSN